MQPVRELPSLRRRLVADHRALDTLFDALLNDIHGGDSRVCQASWGRFEQALLSHIDAEEVFLLPSFEQVDPRETAALRQEHATLRHLLADMGVRLELHAVKEEHVKRLVVALRTHAAREEALLYRWADKLDPELAASLLKKLLANGER
jgi:hemerythrin superfamily protein